MTDADRLLMLACALRSVIRLRDGAADCEDPEALWLRLDGAGAAARIALRDTGIGELPLVAVA